MIDSTRRKSIQKGIDSQKDSKENRIEISQEKFKLMSKIDRARDRERERDS